MSIFSKKFLDYFLERAVKSAAQQLILLVTAAGVFDVFNFDWATAGGLIAGAFILSVATSIVAFQAVERDTSIRDATDEAVTEGDAIPHIGPRAARRRISELETEKAQLVKIVEGAGE